MTVIVNSIWGGRVTQFVDRQISQLTSKDNINVVDSESNKALIIATIDSIISIAYTGVAVVHKKWFDHVIANTISHKKLKFSLVRPGSNFLARPIHVVIKELLFNLNAQLNTDSRAKSLDLELSIVGFHINGKTKKCVPLSWVANRKRKIENGHRYFELQHQKTGKYFRSHPNGLWLDYYGDYGESIEGGLRKLGKTKDFYYDDVEVYIKNLLFKRSQETKTVSSDCLAIQLAPGISGGHIQVTYYSQNKTTPFICPWVIMPRMICSPSIVDSSCGIKSDCNKYVIGGFLDGYSNLHIKTRVPIENKENFNGRLSFSAQKRRRTL